MTATEATEMVDEFDPSLVTLDQVVGLTKKECTAVLKHYAMPVPPAKWKLDEFRKMTAATVAAHIVPVPTQEVTVEIGKPTEESREDPADEIHKTPEESVQPEEPGTALEAHRPDAVSVFPDASKWQQIQSMAVALAKSGIVPDALRDKPDDVTVILLAAHDLGIAPTQALQKIHVIKGKPGLAAELMVALALRDGHVISPDPGNDREKATIHYKRRDNGDSGSVSFTIEEAIDAKLVERTKDGGLREVKGKPTWVQFTADMLWARAVSRMMRRAFPDATAGISYTPDELGYIDADNNPPKSTAGRHGEATVTLNEQREKLSNRAKGLPKDEQQALVEEWRKRNYPKTPGTGPDNPARPDFGSLTPAVVKAIDRFIDEMVEARGPAEPEEAETVPAEGSEASNPVPGGAEAGEADETVGPDPGNAPAATEGISPAEAGSMPEERCGGCGEPFALDDVTIQGADGEWYHAGHEPL